MICYVHNEKYSQKCGLLLFRKFVKGHGRGGDQSASTVYGKMSLCEVYDILLTFVFTTKLQI